MEKSRDVMVVIIAYCGGELLCLGGEGHSFPFLNTTLKSKPMSPCWNVPSSLLVSWWRGTQLHLLALLTEMKLLSPCWSVPSFSLGLGGEE